MIILIGPDGGGKTTLARSLGLPIYKFSKGARYEDYLIPLCKLEFSNAILDRHIICEYPYSICMKRQFGYTLKQWHNILLLTLIQKPLIILCTHKPFLQDYPIEQYLPYERWDQCLNEYRNFLNSNHVSYIEYDYSNYVKPEQFLMIDREYRDEMSWWVQHWKAGYGCIGSPNPDVLLVAERIGPNNLNNLPFETGPTGYMLSDMLSATGTPLGKFAVTNMIKSFRRDTRQVNARDVELLEEEISHLKPKKVIFMGSPARRGIPIAKAHGCETGTIVHLGSLNYAGIKDMTGYNNEWRKLIGLVPTKRFKEV